MQTFQKNHAKVKRFSLLVKVMTTLQNFTERLTPAPFRLLKIGSAFWQSKALYAVVKLGIADNLGDNQMHTAEIANVLGLDENGIARLIRAVAAMGIFEEVAPRTYCNNTVSTYLRRDYEDNVCAMILLHNAPEMSAPWSLTLEQGIREGKAPFHLANGVGLFDYMDDNPDFAALFADAMNTSQTLIGNSYVTDFNWGRFDRIFDIGGSSGSKSASILSQYPHMSAIVVDKNLIAVDSNKHDASVITDSTLSRMTFQAGDVFSDIPKATSDKDVYLLSAVLHAFSDNQCIQALTYMRKQLGNSGARIVVMELIMPDMNADYAIASFDLQMFMGTEGKERTMSEWLRIFYESNLLFEEVVELRSLGKLMVLRAKHH